MLHLAGLLPVLPLLEPLDKNRFKRSQSLYRCSMGKEWFGHGPSSNFSKWSGIPSTGLWPPLRSAAATSEPSCHCLFFFLMGWLEAPSPTSSSRFALPLRRSKIAPTASSPETWLVAMLRSSFVVHGPLHPSLSTRDS